MCVKDVEERRLRGGGVETCVKEVERRRWS